MPNKGSSWQWIVIVTEPDNTTHDEKVIGSCNGTFASASYFKDDGYGNLIVPDGSYTADPSGVACEEQAVEAWAVANYPNRH